MTRAPSPRPIRRADLRLDCEPALVPPVDDPRLAALEAEHAAAAWARLALWAIFARHAQRRQTYASDPARAAHLARVSRGFRAAADLAARGFRPGRAPKGRAAR